MAFAVIILLLLMNCVAAEYGYASSDNKLPPKITAVIPTDFPPSYYRDHATGKAAGFAVDIMDELAKRIGVKVEYVFGKPWDEIHEMLLSGKADVIPNLTVHESRSEIFAFTDTVSTTPINLVVPSHNTKITSLTPGITVGVIRGSSAEAYVQKNTSIQLKRFNDMQSLLFAVLAGRIDAALTATPNLIEVARQARVEDKIRIIFPPVIESKRALALRKEDTALLMALNNAIDGFIGSPEYQKIYTKWYGTPPAFWTVENVAILSFACLITLAAGMALWRYLAILRLNRELQESISEQKLSQLALQESTERFQRVSALTSDIAYSCIEHNGRFSIEWMTGSAELITGYTCSEIQGRGCWVFLVLDDDIPLFRQNVVDLRQGMKATCELRIRHRHGSILWVTSFTECISDPRNPEQRILYGSLVNITDRKLVQNELAAQEIRLRTLFESIPALVWLKDPDGVYLACNPMFERLYGALTKDIIGKTDYDFVDEEQAEFFRKHDANAIKMGHPTANEEWLTFADTGYRGLFHTIKTPMYDSLGNVIGVLGIAHDITERHEITLSLENTRRQLANIIDFLPDATFVIDNGKQVVTWNKAMEEMTGVSKREMIGQGDYAYTIPFYGYRRPQLLDLLDTSDAELEAKYRNVKRKGDRLFAEAFAPALYGGKGAHIWMTVAPLVDAQGIRTGAVESIRDISELKAAEKALKLSEEKFSEAFRISPFVLTISEPESGRYVEVNDAFTKILGYSREEVIGRSSVEVGAWFSSAERQTFLDVLMRDGQCIGHPTRMRHKDGSVRDISISATIISYEDRKDLLAIIEDVTEKKKLEAQLFQSQKMESVGRLAGGIAHDYNNMLAVMFIAIDLIKHRLAPDDPVMKHILGIEKAAVRSRDITRQLLAFSRKQIIAPRPSDLNALILEIGQSLAHLIGEDIDLQFSLAPDLGQIMIDPSQIDQILVNLSVNARDAMPNGGKLTIETANSVLRENDCLQYPGSTAGAYICLTVTDNGIGMAKKTLDYIFEPFFTTKEVGKGTGLGLATVFGIMKQNHGFINVYSEPGHGTSFRLYFPRIQAELAAIESTDATNIPCGTEDILLVEDDEILCRMTHQTLSLLGYTVTAFSNSREALSFIEKNRPHIELLITDVVMPEMNGAQLKEQLCALLPIPKVLFMSGYTSDAIVHRGVLDEGVEFIQKPFSVHALAHKIRQVLDS